MQARIQGVCAAPPLTRNPSRVWEITYYGDMEAAATMVGEGRGGLHRWWPPRERRRRWRSRRRRRPPTATTASFGGAWEAFFIAFFAAARGGAQNVAVHGGFGCFGGGTTTLWGCIEVLEDA